jgi:hypothetical protein
MDWNLVWTILGMIFAVFCVFSALMLWMMSRMENRLHTDITNLTHSVDTAISRIDTLHFVLIDMLRSRNE